MSVSVSTGATRPYKIDVDAKHGIVYIHDGGEKLPVDAVDIVRAIETGRHEDIFKGYEIKVENINTITISYPLLKRTVTVKLPSGTLQQIREAANNAVRPSLADYEHVTRSIASYMRKHVTLEAPVPALPGSPPKVYYDPERAEKEFNRNAMLQQIVNKIYYTHQRDKVTRILLDIDDKLGERGLELHFYGDSPGEEYIAVLPISISKSLLVRALHMADSGETRHTADALTVLTVMHYKNKAIVDRKLVEETVKEIAEIIEQVRP